MNTDQFRQRMRRTDYIGLDSLIRLTDAPAIDPYFIEWQHRGCNEQLAEIVYRCLTSINGRLFNAGFSNYRQGIVASSTILRCLENYLHFRTLKIRSIKSSVIGNNLYILTAKAGEDMFIHPPYNEYGGVMSWDEYYLRVIAGQELRLMVRVPWAQAKITDIE